MARFAGALIASTVFITILNNVLASDSATRVVRAAEAAGASPAVATAVLAALPSGAKALMSINGATAATIEAAGSAYIRSYVQATRTVAYASIGFGSVAVVACFFLEDITPKMTPKIEIFLENDVNAEKNKFH